MSYIWTEDNPEPPMGPWEWVALAFLLAIIISCVYDVWHGIVSLF